MKKHLYILLNEDGDAVAVLDSRDEADKAAQGLSNGRCYFSVDNATFYPDAVACLKDFGVDD